MKKYLLIAMALAFTALGTGCGGGGGSSSPVPELTQVEKANKFVKGLNYYEYQKYEALKYSDGTYKRDEYGYIIYGYVTYYDYSTQYAVAKGVSAQKGFAVVMDTYSNKYYAISMQDFYSISAPGATYYSNTDAKAYDKSAALNGLAYFNLRYNSGNGTFTQILFDGSEGLTFKATELSSTRVDLVKAKAQAYAAKVAKIESSLGKLGMSSKDKAHEAAALIVAAQTKNGSANLTGSQIDDVMSKITGVTLTEAVSAARGSLSEQATVLAKAVDAGAISSAADGIALVQKVVVDLGLSN